MAIVKTVVYLLQDIIKAVASDEVVAMHDKNKTIRHHTAADISSKYLQTRMSHSYGCLIQIHANTDVTQLQISHPNADIIWLSMSQTNTCTYFTVKCNILIIHGLQSD